jgi:hypothetical protein
MSRDETGLLAFAGLIVVLLIAWVVFVWDGIVIQVERPSAPAIQLDKEPLPLNASATPLSLSP